MGKKAYFHIVKQAKNPLTLEQFKASPESYFQGYLTLQQTVADLVFQLGNLQRQIYGSKSEKRPLIDPDQISLGLDVPAMELPAVEPQTQQISYSRTKGKEEKINHPGRMTFPAHLDRDVIIVDPDGMQPDWKLIGQEVTEELDYTPARLYVRQTIRNKYATRSEGIVIGEPLEQVLPKAMAGPALLAQILIDKYADHLPIYRQIERFKRLGVTLAASTISGWIGACCDLILPLHDAIRKQVLQSGYIQADESPIRVLDKDKKGSTHQGYYWVFHSPPRGLVLFDYQKGRSSKLGLDWMEGYQGYLQSDGYAGYDDFVSKAGVTHLSCLAHARRYFEQAEGNDPVRAQKAMSLIQKIYALERTAKDQGYTPDQLLALRQEKALPVWLEMKTWLLAQSTLILPKSPIGKAILYTLARINPLMVYLSDARLLPDNNLVENTIRPLAIGRKNYLFAGSHQAAQRGAILYSLIGCCKRHGINPLTYFTDTLIRIGSHSILRIAELLPGPDWKPQIPDHFIPHQGILEQAAKETQNS
ncbi:MAG: IS66 family transposase [Bacteroidales bacterium]